MPKNNPEHYSEELLQNTNAAHEDMLGAITQTHDAYGHLASPHLELLSEHVGDGPYPFQEELDELIRKEDAMVAPLIREEHQLGTKLQRLEAEKKLEQEFNVLQEKLLPSITTELAEMHDQFVEIEKRLTFSVRRAEDIQSEIVLIFKKQPKRKEDLPNLAQLLHEFHEIHETIAEYKIRMFTKNIRKSNDEQ